MGESRAQRPATDLFSFVRRPTNLGRAWQSVQANSRTSTSPYVRDEAAGFAGDEQRRLRSIASRIQHGSFRFSKSRGVAIPKAGKPGQVRPIVISRVEDRIVQRCVLDALTQHQEIRSQAFQPLSFGGVPKSFASDLSGVRAAISALLDQVREGATHVMIADIEGFFTKVRKSHCVDIIRQHTESSGFISLLEMATAVDLENSEQLWKYKEQFPYGDVGVGQGNCLSPFLGNLLLSEFDKELNQGDCSCIRYIDDVIIAAPSGRAATSRMKKASRLLAALGMRFAPAKTTFLPIRVQDSFEYLGIEFSSGLMRPSRKSRDSIVARVKEVAADSIRMIKRAEIVTEFDPSYSIPKTLSRMAGMAKGWSQHYIFVNDVQTVKDVDGKICDVYLGYLEKARKAATSKKAKTAAAIMGFQGSSAVRFEPLEWPASLTPPPPAHPASAAAAPDIAR